MFKEHPDCELPADESKIWRYLDLPKFLSILESNSLYFTRSDKFEDPYEGTLPKWTSSNIQTTFSEYNNSEEMAAEMLNLIDANRKMTLINCWYSSEYESDGMWKIYSQNGIAIQSTVSRFKDCFQKGEENINISLVKYIDFNDEGLHFFNALAPFFYKRKSFEHEKEIRAIFWNTREGTTEEEIEKMTEDDYRPIKIVEHGKLIPVNLSLLIETIYVSPQAPFWFYSLICSICKRYNLTQPVIHSPLYTVSSVRDANNANEVLKISKEVLDHFYKKDSYRIDIETLKEERSKMREYQNIFDRIQSIEKEVSEITFSQFSGKDALLEFSRQEFTEDDLIKIFHNSIFKKLYFLTGKVDTLFKEIGNSTLTEKEKEILTRSLVYSYTENLSDSAIYLSMQFDNAGIEDTPYLQFSNFTKWMYQLMVDKQI